MHSDRQKNHAVRRFSSKSIQPTDTRISRLMKLSRAVFPTKTAALRPRFTFQSIAALEHIKLERSPASLSYHSGRSHTGSCSLRRYSRFYRSIALSTRKLHHVAPLVVSRLGPIHFLDQLVRNPVSLVTVPALVFTELQLGELADDPEMGIMINLPYGNQDHLRQCLTEVKTKFATTKMVDRSHNPNVQYRSIKNGFYVGNKKEMRYYPMPTAEELRVLNYSWFRSANM